MATLGQQSTLIHCDDIAALAPVDSLARLQEEHPLVLSFVYLQN